MSTRALPLARYCARDLTAVPAAPVLPAGEESPSLPATYLQRHPNMAAVVDRAAAAQLTRCATPWLVGPCSWAGNVRLQKQAVVWLALQRVKPILQLTEDEYLEAGLAELLNVVRGCSMAGR